MMIGGTPISGNLHIGLGSWNLQDWAIDGWLVVWTPWKIWVRQLGWLATQYFWENKIDGNQTTNQIKSDHIQPTISSLSSSCSIILYYSTNQMVYPMMFTRGAWSSGSASRPSSPCAPRWSWCGAAAPSSTPRRPRRWGLGTMGGSWDF